MIIDYYYPIESGAEIFARYLSEYLVEKKHHVDVLTTGIKNMKTKEVVNKVGIYRIDFPSMFKKIYLLKEYYFIKKAIELNKKNRYDLIHLHLASTKAITGCILKKILKKPVLLTVQGGDLFDYGARLKRLFKPLIKFALRQLDCVHTVSSYYGKIVKSWMIKNIIVIPNCIDLNRFSCKKKEREGIITVSRLIKKNGIHHLIQALTVLRSKEIIVELKIIGTGLWEKKLKNLSRKLGLEKQVTFLGYIPNEKIKEHLSSSLLFLRSSLWEGFGISFIEAMACKTCVIGTDVGGIPDIIKDGKNGLLVKPGNIDQLANAIEKLLNDKKLREKLAKEGCRTVQQKFSCEKVLPRMEALYRRIIDETCNS